MNRKYTVETTGPMVTWENFTLVSDGKYIKWEDWVEKVRASKKQD